MKKLIYLLFPLSFTSLAQKAPGYHPESNYAYEDFGKASEYANLVWANKGTFPVKVDSAKSVISDIHDCYSWTGNYSYEMIRNTADKNSTLIVSQPYSSYQPLYLNFGKNNSGRKNTLNLSKGNAVLTYSVKNTSTITLQFYLSVQDSAGKIINAVGNHKKPFEAYMDLLLYRLNPGESLSGTVDFNTKGYYVDYADTLNFCGNTNYVALDSSFNKSIVSGFGITVVNNLMNIRDNYKSFSISNASLLISDIGIGSPMIINGIDTQTEENHFAVFPNPVRDILHFSKALKNVKLNDFSGNTVFESPEANEIDLNNIPRGMYILHTSSQDKPQKIVVE